MSGQLAYFDNAATTFPKPATVYDFADSFYRNSGGNIGRGDNALAASAGKIALKAKDNLRMLYGCEASEVVFTSSATDALNRILLGIELEEGDAVYTTPFEHNAVSRPLNHLAKTKGVSLEQLAFDGSTLKPDFAAIERSFEKNHPRLVVLTHASNVCGAVVPVLELCKLAKRYGSITVVDMSQTAGLLPLEISNEAIDFAVFAGHKTLYGPFGIGGFFCKRGTHLNPVFFGGNGINSVEQDMPSNIVQMEEVGSQNTYAIAGLKASTDWILSESMEALRKKENGLRDNLLSLLGRYRNIHIVANDMECERIGVISALFDGYSPDEIESILGQNGVAVRSGIQCSPYAHRFLETLPAGTVRFSVSALTTGQDFALLKTALDILENS